MKDNTYSENNLGDKKFHLKKKEENKIDEKITHDLKSTLRSSVDTTGEVFKELISVLDSTVKDMDTRESAKSIIINLNNELINTITKLDEVITNDLHLNSTKEEE